MVSPGCGLGSESETRCHPVRRSTPSGWTGGLRRPTRRTRLTRGLPSTSSTARPVTVSIWTTGHSRPPLRGADFQAKWQVRSLDVLFDVTSATMPQERPGSLTDDQYVQVLAFMLQENGIDAGSTQLSADLSVLETLSPGWRSQGGGLSPGVALPPVPYRRNPLDNIRPVTDGMLKNPDREDWLLWRRTYDASGYSPLDQIDTKNVDDLRVAWSWSLPAGPNEATPIVHDGVLFVHGYGDKVSALDAATGDLLWHYAHRLPRDVAPSLKRGMSIYGERLYVPTSDMHVVALDVTTGEVSLGPRDRSEPRQCGPAALDRRDTGCARQGYGGHDRSHRRWQLHRGARCQHRDRTVALQYDPSSRPARRKQLERLASRRAQRRVGLDPRKLRPGEQPSVLWPREYLRHGSTT